MIKNFFLKFLIFILFLGEITHADEWSGGDYANNSSVQLSHAERLLGSVSFKGDENILDIGCGDGKITALLAHQVPKGIVIGIDPSLSMLEKAEKHRAENLAYFQKSAEDFHFSFQFDHIFSIHVLHWVAEQEKALKNICRHLKPGGKVHFILAPSKEGLPFHQALLKTLDNWEDEFKGFKNPQQVYNLETYRKLMVNAGFHIDAMHYIYHQSVHENQEKLTMWIKQWLPYGKYLSEDKQDVFLEELIGNYLLEAGYPQDFEGPVKWGEYVLIVEGTRSRPILNSQ